MNKRRAFIYNTATRWGAVSKTLHWLLAVMIVGQFVLGKVVEEMRISPQKFDLFVWHKSIGITILILVVLRIFWRLRNAPPSAPTAIGGWERRAAQLGHGLLYLLMITVPVTGWWVSDTSRIPFRFFWSLPVPDLMDADRAMSELAGEVHEFLTLSLIAVVIGHVLAALRHHFVLHNNTLSRMLPFDRGRKN